VLLPYNSLERQYLRFGEPIDTAQYEGRYDDTELCLRVYQVRGG
jgi:hypothetical protein